MDAELKARWVKALRSGKYKQTDGDLKDRHGYCCLGVLCNINGATWVPDEYGTLYPFQNGRRMSMKEKFYLNRSTLRRFGISAGQQIKLARMNDGCNFPTFVEKHTFKQIADYIEANL